MSNDHGNAAAGCSCRINGVDVAFSDGVITGHEALTRSGYVPASEFQLILVRDGRTHQILGEDEIDLRQQAGRELRAFGGDRTFAFTVDEIGQVWGDEEMEVEEFLRHWPSAADHHWELEQDDRPDTVLETSGVLSFGPGGVEHVVSRKSKHQDKVLVMVVTTAGVFPNEGSKRYPVDTAIATVLDDAARKLKITAAPDWVAQVAGVDLIPVQTFAQAGLSGSIRIEWGAREGGGGNV